jgi:hypothetical protein
MLRVFEKNYAFKLDVHLLFIDFKQQIQNNYTKF